MYKNILIAVALDHERDISDKITVARRLCADGGKITLLAVVEEPPAYVAEYVVVKPKTDILQAMKERLEAVAGDQSDLQRSVVFGGPGVAIPKHALDHQVDLIVMGSHRPGPQDYFLGTTASRVVRRAACAVFVMR